MKNMVFSRLFELRGRPQRKVWGLLLLAAPLLFNGCRIGYSLSAASIPAEAKTVSIAFFPNHAQLVAPILSPTFTEALQDRFNQQTRLMLVPENGDLAFEGEIVGYTSTPVAISGNEYALRNNLTISVRVRFTSVYEPQYNFDKTFSAFLPYDASQLLQTVEPTLIPEIVDQLVEDIFNAAASNW